MGRSLRHIAGKMGFGIAQSLFGECRMFLWDIELVFKTQHELRLQAGLRNTTSIPICQPGNSSTTQIERYYDRKIPNCCMFIHLLVIYHKHGIRSTIRRFFSGNTFCLRPDVQNAFDEWIEKYPWIVCNSCSIKLVHLKKNLQLALSNSRCIRSTPLLTI